MKSRLVGLGLLALTVAAPASALTFVQDVNVNNRFGGYFNPFDTSLGTLTRVTVQASVRDSRGATVDFYDPGFSGAGRILVEGAVGTTLTDLISYSGDSGLVSLSSSSPWLTVTGTGSGVSEFAGDDLLRFFGTGPLYVGVDKAELASVSYDLPTDFPGYVREMTNPAGISIAHRITYEYDVPGSVLPQVETAVPEPASWAMMIIGFGAIGHTLRRSRRSRRLARAA